MSGEGAGAEDRLLRVGRSLGQLQSQSDLPPHRGLRLMAFPRNPLPDYGGQLRSANTSGIPMR